MAILRMILMFCTVSGNRHREDHAQTIALCVPSCPASTRVAAPHLGVVLRGGAAVLRGPAFKL